MDARRQTLLITLARQIRQTSAFVEAQGLCQEEALPTPAELARLLGEPHDKVKQALKTLKDWGLVRAIGMSPKRYCFDDYQFAQISESASGQDDPLGLLLEALST